MDNGPVTMLSTIHEIIGNENKLRHHPRITSTNGAKVRSIFGNSTRKLLPIPKIINDYNLFMGGVDIADQLRSYYQKTRRTWMPMFFWLLDTAIIN
jgi:hypothetical protein